MIGMMGGPPLGKQVSILVANGGYVITSSDPKAMESAYRAGMPSVSIPEHHVAASLEEAMYTVRLLLGGEPRTDVPAAFREI